MLNDFFQSFLWIALELTVLFIVVSFVINLLQGLLPFEKIEQKLSGKNKAFAALAALLFAFITPFCSCSTIPVVVGMLKKKLPFGIVMIFLFASPVLDPTILTIMGVILGWKVAFIYTIVTATLAVLIGFTLEALGFERAVKNVVIKGGKQETKRFNVKEAWQETVVLMKEVFPYLLLGAGIGAAIHGLVPTDWIANTLGSEKWWLVPVAAIIGIPLYIRLSTMIPISQILITNGMATGSVMALLISSAGASLPEIILLKSIFKKELVITFIISVFTMASLSGFIFYLI
ncbi:permease [Lottiidibacillus patelloidae]|uniref:Permease n=1 Tax=Lottiidibacillus patelloidae TaxID=2670334 RepID=A0A263BTC3_9BACI|nr:permease [Lottiidibacillus patelloidae]OZM56949.1 permease [Lottiidibacillus patelloidae]